MEDYRRSTRILLWLLGIWGVVGFSKPDVIPTAVVAVVGAVVPSLVVLSHFRRLRLQVIPVSLAAIAIASTWWSGSQASAWHGMFYAGVTFSAIVFASYVPLREAVRVLDVGFKAIVVTTLLMLAAIPDAAFDDRYPNVGTLTGPYVHKNILGTVLVLGLLTTLYARRWKNRAAEVVVWVTLYSGMIVMTRSTTAYVLGAVVIGSVAVTRSWSVWSLQRRAFALGAISVLALAGGVLLRSRIFPIFDALGREETLYGRLRIWSMTIEAWKMKPWFGYGWETAYDENNVAANLIKGLTGWYVPSSHSGYLSMLLQLGVVGAVLLIIFTCTQVKRAIGQAAVSPDADARWMLLAVIIFAANNILDSRLDSTAWFVVVSCATWLEVKRFRRETTRTPTPHRSRITEPQRLTVAR